jgi:hypothetical protein
MLGLEWLVGVGNKQDFSFHPDDGRFVQMALNFQEENPDGYVVGMASHLFLILKIITFCHIDQPNPLIVLRVVSVFYASLTILVLFIFSRILGLTRGKALLSSGLLSLVPIHVVNSNFGTADITALFYSYACLCVAVKYLRTQKSVWFILSVICSGAAVAVKFFIPLLVGIGILIGMSRDRVTKAISALFLLSGSFSIVSMFNYTIWDFKRLLYMLAFDNVIITGGNNFFDQFLLYAWDLVSALGIPLAAIVVIGIFLCSRKNLRGLNVKEIWNYGKSNNVGIWFLIVAVMVTQALLIMTAGIHGTRHILIYIPIACVFAAHVIVSIFEKTKLGYVANTLILSGIFSYMVYNAISMQRLYRNDVRSQMAEWAIEKKSKGKPVIAFMDYSHVKGTELKTGKHQMVQPGSFILTCDLEFARYMNSRSAKDIYHAYGGQDRVDFFRDLFEGRSNCKIVYVFRQEPISIEQTLIDAGLLRPLSTFIPRECYAVECREDIRNEPHKKIKKNPGW